MSRKAALAHTVDGIAHAKLTIHVTGGAGAFAQVWRDGVMLEPELAVTGDDFTGSFDDAPGAGDFRYRVELVSNGNQRLVITSHFYVHAIASSGGGCDAGDGIGGGAAPVLLMLVPWLRRRQRARPDRRHARRFRMNEISS